MLSTVMTRARRQRFRFFCDLASTVAPPFHVLDVGGEQAFWESMGYTDRPGVSVTILNVQPQLVTRPNFTAVVGDARSMPGFSDGEFDIVFSNSVIEHVGDLPEQQQMAHEVLRVGKRYFVQTPNYYFPLEPHFFTLGFQFLPLTWRAWMIQHMNLGQYRRRPDWVEAVGLVSSIRLLKRAELQDLFPDAQIWEEKLLGLTKSFVAHGGW
jgi:SAM-dependent methyltransferase